MPIVFSHADINLKKTKQYAFSWTISSKCISAFTVTRKLLVSGEEGLRLKSTCKGLENLFLSILPDPWYFAQAKQ